MCSRLAIVEREHAFSSPSGLEQPSRALCRRFRDGLLRREQRIGVTLDDAPEQGIGRRNPRIQHVWVEFERVHGGRTAWHDAEAALVFRQRMRRGVREIESR